MPRRATCRVCAWVRSVRDSVRAQRRLLRSPAAYESTSALDMESPRWRARAICRTACCRGGPKTAHRARDRCRNRALGWLLPVAPTRRTHCFANDRGTSQLWIKPPFATPLFASPRAQSGAERARRSGASLKKSSGVPLLNPVKPQSGTVGAAGTRRSKDVTIAAWRITQPRHASAIRGVLLACVDARPWG